MPSKEVSAAVYPKKMTQDKAWKNTSFWDIHQQDEPPMYTVPLSQRWWKWGEGWSQGWQRKRTLPNECVGSSMDWSQGDRQAQDSPCTHDSGHTSHSGCSGGKADWSKHTRRENWKNVKSQLENNFNKLMVKGERSRWQRRMGVGRRLTLSKRREISVLKCWPERSSSKEKYNTQKRGWLSL